MGETREMTLEEWMGGLPTNHTANREYEALRTEIAQLKAENADLRKEVERLKGFLGDYDLATKNADLRKEIERLRGGQRTNCCGDDDVCMEYEQSLKENADLRSRLEKAEAGMHDKCSCVGCSLQYTAECVPYCKLLTAKKERDEWEEACMRAIAAGEGHEARARETEGL